jgi:hypothetical protein
MLVFSLGPVAGAQTLSEKLKGRILLDVQQNGEAWYVKPTDGSRVYMGRPDDAFRVMRQLGVGITNANLIKIPLGVITPEIVAGKRAGEQNGDDAVDAVVGCRKQYLDHGDVDGFMNCSIALMSKQVGFDVEKDSDGDGYSDATEIVNNYNPYGSGKMPVDQAFTKKNAGKIFLQVEEKGQAWYVDPTSVRRYSLGTPTEAFTVMRGFGLGISNRDIAKVSIEVLSGGVKPTAVYTNSDF